MPFVCACNGVRRGHGACKKINKKLFVHELAALTAEDLDAAPRAVGQCRSTGRHLFILKQPFLMSLLVIVGGWHESCRLG